MVTIKLEDYSRSLSPIIDKSSQYLILGTMPGKESIRKKQYYAHPNNYFWRILFYLFNSDIKEKYSDKIELLTKNKIAVWDVCHSCFRKGSLDSNIKKEIPNKIFELIDTNPTINKIIFNGKKSEKLYKKYFDYFIGIQYFTVLSTSPANATFTFKQKLDNWEAALF